MNFKKIALTILGAIVAVILGIRLISGVGSIFSAFNPADSGYGVGQSTDSMYISAAKEILNEGLRTAGSPIFNRYKVFESYNMAEIYEKDDYGRAIVFIEVTARAGDETRREEYYVFVNGMTANGEYSYNKTFGATSSIGMLDIFKNANDFGQPQ